jgi:hypothetical protein
LSVRRPGGPTWRSTTMSRWYYCLDHNAVEGKEGCKPSQRLGPYDTEAEASRALEKVAERNAEWDRDPNWNAEGVDD